MSPASGGCPERERLIEQLNLVDHKLSEIQTEIDAARLADRPRDLDAQERLEKVREYRVLVAQSLMRHIGEHGCVWPSARWGGTGSE